VEEAMTKPRSFRLSEEAARQLDCLAAEWGSTKTAAVERAIERAYASLEVMRAMYDDLLQMDRGEDNAVADRKV
jgi:predicted DNA-binding protein